MNYEITQELAKSGHQLAVLLGTQHGMLDASSLVQRIAGQLEVLAAVLREKTKRSDALAAENAALAKFIEDDCWVIDLDRDAYIDAVQCVPEMPTSDAWQREQMAKGVEAFAALLIELDTSATERGALAFAHQLRNGEAV